MQVFSEKMYTIGGWLQLGIAGATAIAVLFLAFSAIIGGQDKKEAAKEHLKSVIFWAGIGMLSVTIVKEFFGFFV